MAKKVLVLCENNKECIREFNAVVAYLREHCFRINRLIYSDEAVGTKDLFVRFLSATDSNINAKISGMELDRMFGFGLQTQRERLKSGIRASSKDAIVKDRIDDIIRMFEIYKKGDKK